MVERKALSEKILVLGVDAMDPKLTRKLVDKGVMPKLKGFLEKAACRDDLVLQGAHPTVTPPMWTTLATGAYPCTHGITCFLKQSSEGLDATEYNITSENCRAEQLWNVFAEAGKKTLVWHWPGSSWPPSSDSPNLSVVDGTQPGSVNVGVASVDSEKILVASEQTESVIYKTKAFTDGKIPCMISDLDVEEREYDLFDKINTKVTRNIMLTHADGEGSGTISDSPFDVTFSPIKAAQDWAQAPEGAKEFVMLHASGLIRRPCQIIPNAAGVYDTVAIYQSKKADKPIATLKTGVFTSDIVDDAFKNDVKHSASRNMRILELKEDGSYLKMWISTGMDIHNDSLWHPKTLHKLITEKVGYPPAVCLVGGSDQQLIEECMIANWTAAGEWQANALNYLIKNCDYEIIFSHFHNIDLQGHLLVKYLKNGKGDLPPAAYQKFMEAVYVQTDNYLGEFFHLMDEGWTIIIVSDHGQICPEYEPPLLSDASGVNVGVMKTLGFTAVKQDADGNDLHELDWANTKAVAVRGNHIYLNIKGRDAHGIVDPADQYEVEEEIMTALYGYRNSETGKRVIAMALRNKDAILLGMGGPECGDIIYWLAEGYNYDHCDSLSTTLGVWDTSVSPIFIAAGSGLKKGFVTDRIIREVDVAPTIAVLGGVRFPAQCEGAPVYQIFERDI